MKGNNIKYQINQLIPKLNRCVRLFIDIYLYLTHHFLTLYFVVIYFLILINFRKKYYSEQDLFYHFNIDFVTNGKNIKTSSPIRNTYNLKLPLQTCFRPTLT